MLSFSLFLYLSYINSLKRVFNVKSQFSVNFTSGLTLRLLRPSLSYIKLYTLKLLIIITLP